MERYPPTIPDDLELLVKPSVDADKQGRGYQRHATTKLAITTWMYALNRHLEKITVVAINPGGLIDSRALRTNTPMSMAVMQTLVLKPLLPLLRFLMGPTIRPAAPAGVDVVDIALDPKFAAERGFFTLLQKDESSPESRDEQTQSRLWTQTLTWAKINKDNTLIPLGDT
ncbi:hypothetical protein JX266_001483 [Neoarthrinium moseri]|uniref:uncharacterized protein n=1 Tax=Neoarthrinium moseri TaxID=1658444 RepID=UPI001FDDD00A|nr:uncharacterized protein JN550_008641 [Neoarthrinium moseri]KAI1853499.1 hypothetical protein JX266_001483 [Neoarthrinium moseri]KAI1864821.1 hypothetical protein JN550_008641 [Neoarthrinium moseri]